MIKSYLKLLALLIISASFGSPLSSAEEPSNNLYKWKDNDGIWHYSKIPPKDDVDMEVAKVANTIIFEKPQENIANQSKDEEIEREKQLLKEKSLNCQSIGRSILDTASAITKVNDKALQDKKMTITKYTKEKRMITKLEDVGSDTNLTDSCLADFDTQPETKQIYDCIINNNKPDNQKACLKKYITIKE